VAGERSGPWGRDVILTPLSRQDQDTFVAFAAFRSWHGHHVTFLQPSSGPNQVNSCCSYVGATSPTLGSACGRANFLSAGPFARKCWCGDCNNSTRFGLAASHGMATIHCKKWPRSLGLGGRRKRSGPRSFGMSWRLTYHSLAQTKNHHLVNIEAAGPFSCAQLTWLIARQASMSDDACELGWRGAKLGGPTDRGIRCGGAVTQREIINRPRTVQIAAYVAIGTCLAPVAGFLEFAGQSVGGASRASPQN
jgi:hypothetical protein